MVTNSNNMGWWWWWYMGDAVNEIGKDWEWIRFYAAPPRRGAAGRCVVSKYVQIIRYQIRSSQTKILKKEVKNMRRRMNMSM